MDNRNKQNLMQEVRRLQASLVVLTNTTNRVRGILKAKEVVNGELDVIDTHLIELDKFSGIFRPLLNLCNINHYANRVKLHYKDENWEHARMNADTLSNKLKECDVILTIQLICLRAY